MTGVRVYRSKFSGEEIDGAIIKAMMFNPEENGWIHVSSNEAYPISLGDFITPGNYVVDYFTDGPASLEGLSPINVSVVDDNGTLTEFIVYLNNVFYRFFNEAEAVYEETWKMKKTTNTFYINEEPAEPGLDTIKVVPNENDEYVMSWWNGEKWVEITYPDVMRQSVYDPQNRSTDFFKYTDELFQQMTSTQVGMVLDDTDITNKWLGDVSCVRTDSNGDTYITFKNSSKMIIMNSEYEIKTFDLPVTMIEPQIGCNRINAYVGDESVLTDMIFLYENGGSRIWVSSFSLNDTELIWGELPLSEIPFSLVRGETIEDISISPVALYGHQIGFMNLDSHFSMILKHENNAGVSSYYKFQMTADLFLLYPVSIPTYITDKDLYFRKCMFWGDSFFRGRDGMTPVKTSAVIEPENAIVAAAAYPYTMGMEGTETIVTVATISWKWREQNKAYTQVPVLSFSAHLDSGIEIVPSISTYLSGVDYYVALSNFKEFFGDFVGYGITTTGKLDKIEVIYDWDTESYQLDINTVNQIEDLTMIWEGMGYNYSGLFFFGKTVAAPSSVHLFVSNEGQNILDAVSTHLMNGDIHFTDQDRRLLGTRETKDDAEVKINRITIDNREYIDERLNESVEVVRQMHADYARLLDEFEQHIADERLHTNAEEKAYWDSKANGEHGHNLDGRVKINASQIVEGILDIDRIPRGAKERITKVQTIEERNLLTIDDVQNGDRVAVKYEDANRENAYVIYTVVKQELLCHIDEETGEKVLAVDEAFHEDAAGTGVYIDWVNVENTPHTLAGFGITDSYTKTETEIEIDKRIKYQSDILEARFLKYDLEELYRTIHDTNDETHIIEEEMTDAIGISEQVQIMDDLLKLQEERINQMAEDLSEADAIVDDLLKKFE